jgi:hypothetical protein
MEAASASPAIRHEAARRPAATRSAVTNGRRLHVVPPGDTRWARRFADVLAEIISDLGGADLLSEGQRQLARRATTIAIACEKMEGEAAAGEKFDVSLYGELTDRLGRTFHRLGLKRVQRDIPLTLGDLLRSDQREQPDVAAAAEAAP